ncbi:MAG TPA: tetratricopeptide repeat protein [Plasticicumulans sp.]|uniref:tetratricopeptide repeat protein n=1 Tax=Plasticicumulans sp. TaxID=2307179 RepID=UPI002C3549BE|nr:tetratricopeptide repeat protein [Plasticicumulans sp.]HMV39147.1 tetratricopeptide repeat protein [Plasticicumulans sp.]HMW29465.1 tetratricopeptide repeat protein [Plasticicumulans sp.]HMW41774.1 tetratricopeptide repeat protein [Plasticicumulans sp.]HMX54828.1 tetratricopeptide repeat protein [Plasticicumulans sp.]HMZ09403.1 tetratricopeptide repeat protein [Plasticicumulans sp.]
MRTGLRIVCVLGAVAMLGGCASWFGDGGDKEKNLATTTNVRAPSTDPFEIDKKQAAQLNLQLGVGYIRQGDYQVAVSKLRKSLSFDDDSAEAHNALGIALEELRSYDEAAREYDRALALKSGYTAALINRTRLQCVRGTQAAEGEQRFIELAGSGTLEAPETAWIEAASCARRQQAWARAGAHLDRALEVAPGAMAQVLYERALLAFEQRNLPQARELLRRLHGDYGSSARSLGLAVRVEDALGGSAQRRQLVAELLRAYPDSPEARSYRPR